MAQATIVLNPKTKKYDLMFKGRKITSSKKSGYLNYLVTKQQNEKILKLGITSAVMSAGTDVVITSPAGDALDPSPVSPYTIDERFSFMGELVDMVIARDAKSLIITGEGGIGKTYSVIQAVKSKGMVSFHEITPSIENLSIEIEDDEQVIEEKALAQMNQPKADYVVIKGHASAAALYRILYENKDRLVIFDDCDSVLKDPTAIRLLKAALDSYEDRWVHWLVERSFGDSDLPSSFKFNGSIIFISNMSLEKVDEAVKTRCYKVDLSMTKPQRIERMRSVLENVMPDVPFEQKVEALELLDENKELTNDINFRSLMNLISIRISDTVKDWKRLGVYALTEQ